MHRPSPTSRGAGRTTTRRRVTRPASHGSGLRKGHQNNARAVDQPIATLIRDLKPRGLLDSTVVIWAGEFGRTPFAHGHPWANAENRRRLLLETYFLPTGPSGKKEGWTITSE